MTRQLAMCFICVGPASHHLAEGVYVCSDHLNGTGQPYLEGADGDDDD